MCHFILFEVLSYIVSHFIFTITMRNRPNRHYVPHSIDEQIETQGCEKQTWVDTVGKWSGLEDQLQLLCSLHTNETPHQVQLLCVQDFWSVSTSSSAVFSFQQLAAVGGMLCGECFPWVRTMVSPWVTPSLVGNSFW